MSSADRAGTSGIRNLFRRKKNKNSGQGEVLSETTTPSAHSQDQYSSEIDPNIAHRPSQASSSSHMNENNYRRPTDDSDSSDPLSISDLIHKLNAADPDSIQQVMPKIIYLSKEPDKIDNNELVTGGAIPALVRILANKETPLKLRVLVEAAICNLTTATDAFRRLFDCNAVSILVNNVVGDHEALTGGAAIIFRSMLISESLIRTMIASNASMMLFRGLMLVENTQISDTIIECLIQMNNIPDLSNQMVKNGIVQCCMLYLHVLARCHYIAGFQRDAEIGVRLNEVAKPAFTERSKREALISYLLGGNATSAMPSPSVRASQWEDRLRDSPVIGCDQNEPEFTNVDLQRAALVMELMTCIVHVSTEGCGILASMQHSLDILTYWIKKGNCLIRQGGLLTSCSLLRNGYRGFVILRDAVGAVQSVFKENDRDIKGVSKTKYRRAAADAVTDLSNFGGDNIRIAIAHSDIIPLLIKQLEVEDYPLQHSVMEALYTLSAHAVALTTIFDSNAIPILCRFLHDGLEDDRLGTEHGRRGRPAISPLTCFTRKRVVTMSMSQAEIDRDQIQEIEYSRVRRLEYCAALLRSIAALQSGEWVSDYSRSNVVPIAVDALVQNCSSIIKRQALGILASLVSYHDNSIHIQICAGTGVGVLLNLRLHMERMEDENSPYWTAWINYILYYLAQNLKTRPYVEHAMRQEFGESLDLGDNNIQQLLKPEQDYMDVNWIAKIN